MKCCQCVQFYDEILICGSNKNDKCYSYHVVSQTYKPICKYPDDVSLLIGHNVVAYKSSSNKEMILLSFGGLFKHTLMMRYRSVWDETNITPNQWMTLKNKVIIGESVTDEEEDEYNLEGCRGIISGINQNLLFVVHPPNRILVIELDFFGYATTIVHDSMPTDSTCIEYPCFVPLTKNGKPLTNQFLCVCKDKSILICYNEYLRTFCYEFLSVPSFIQYHFGYAFVTVNDRVILFGGYTENENEVTFIHIYTISENQWILCDYNLPPSISMASAIWCNVDNSIHIIGGPLLNDIRMLSAHLKIDARELIGVEKGKNKARK
ncbi:hypothetical protein RFI_13987 [Reticulomyxa filosa]|uniref:Kelch motif family protein n=1 Tax=Reticulomyxa filosa TaxID=46433 RepID=X6NAY2_RETFI|nr:hypothetical protein RFI_13987 [Reticulomyxa filosa]|eukprot:ETO23196.1 hypothetical protein RFI_13987 [Reticulomyxa filosa]